MKTTATRTLDKYQGRGNGSVHGFVHFGSVRVVRSERSGQYAYYLLVHGWVVAGFRVLPCSGCCRVQDVAGFRVLPGSGCCRVQGVAGFRVLPCSGCCRVQGVADSQSPNGGRCVSGVGLTFKLHQSSGGNAAEPRRSSHPDDQPFNQHRFTQKLG